MNLDKRYLHKKLKKKWFKIDKSKADIYCRFYINGEIMTTITSKVGGHSKEKYKTLDDDIVSQIYRCLHFDDKSQFLGFLECDPTKEQYQKKLFDNGLIRFTLDENRTKPDLPNST